MQAAGAAVAAGRRGWIDGSSAGDENWSDAGSSKGIRHLQQQRTGLGLAAAHSATTGAAVTAAADMRGSSMTGWRQLPAAAAAAVHARQQQQQQLLQQQYAPL
jgi:hypothetical protein